MDSLEIQVSPCLDRSRSTGPMSNIFTVVVNGRSFKVTAKNLFVNTSDFASDPHAQEKLEKKIGRKYLPAFSKELMLKAGPNVWTLSLQRNPVFDKKIHKKKKKASVDIGAKEEGHRVLNVRDRSKDVLLPFVEGAFRAQESVLFNCLKSSMPSRLSVRYKNPAGDHELALMEAYYRMSNKMRNTKLISYYVYSGSGGEMFSFYVPINGRSIGFGGNEYFWTNKVDAAVLSSYFGMVVDHRWVAVMRDKALDGMNEAWEERAKVMLNEI